jgi:putative ABC transport system substrate-binding protein
MMDRRTFICTAARGLAVVPLAALAQQPATVYRIGVLSPNARESPTSKAVHDELGNSLRDLGYVEGRNLVVDARWAEGKTDRLPGLAAELVALKPDVIVANTTQATQAVKQAAEAIPIVMINVTDPVGFGLVASLARPGGNVTGLTDFGLELSAKSVELLREIIPKATHIAVLMSDNPVHPFQLREIESAAKRFEITIVPAFAITVDELERAISFAKANAAALIVLGGGLQSGNREKISELAKKAKLPTVAYVRPYVDAGALASYGQKVLPQFRLAATYVDKILKGAKPADLPVEQPTKFELIINLKTAKSIGIVIPQPLLLRADEVIQ